MHSQIILLVSKQFLLLDDDLIQILIKTKAKFYWIVSIQVDIGYL